MSKFRFQKEIKTILVDDEEIASHRLRKLLEAYPMINIIGEAKDGKSAVSLINDLQPDLVFLDIQMPEFSGFEVISQLDTVPMIVFVTAYQEYAVKAFEKNSLDYLLKPVEADRLSLTIDRILEKKAGETDVMAKIQQLIGEITTEKHITTIPVKVGNKINLVHIADVCFFEAKDKYVFIHTAENENLTDYSLSNLQQRLPPEFIRIHRSFIVNKMKIKEIQKYFKGTYIFVMNDQQKTKIRTTSSYYESIKTRLLNP